MDTPQDKLDALFPVPAPAPRASTLTPVHLAGPSHKSADTVVELLQDNHKKLHIFFNDKHFHNHATHHLLAIYSMGANPDLLKAAYATHLVYQRPAFPSPGEVTKDNWKEFLGDERYYQAYLKFFSDQLLEKGPGSVLEEYVLSKNANAVPAKDKGRPNMLLRLVGGFLHPLIHSGYGAEFGQLGMWAEGLAECSVENPLSSDILPDSLFDNLVPSTPSIISRVASLTLSSKSSTDKVSPHALSILAKVSKDPDFKASVLGLPVPDGSDEFSANRVIRLCKGKLLKLLEEWTVEPNQADLDKKTEEVMWMNALIYGVGGWGGREFSEIEEKEFNGDFFLMHLVTSSLFLPSHITHLPPAVGVLLLRTYFITAIVLYIARGRPTLPISEFFASVTDAPTPPGVHPTPSKEVFRDDVTYTNPVEARKNWLAAGGDKIVIPNPWLAIIQSTLVHPDEHLCKAQRSLMHLSAMLGATAPGAFKSLAGELDGAEALDGTLFIRIAGLTANRLGWVREGQAQKYWDHNGFFAQDP